MCACPPVCMTGKVGADGMHLSVSFGTSARRTDLSDIQSVHSLRVPPSCRMLKLNKACCRLI